MLKSETMRFLIAIILLLYLSNTEGIIKSSSVEKKLLQRMMKQYEEYGVSGRPVKDSNEKIVVTITITLQQLLDLDENKQMLRTNGWLNLLWKDSLLVWDPKENANITELRIFSKHVWTPDIKLYNFADERLKDFKDFMTVVGSDGSIQYVPQGLFKSSCQVQFYYFPYDTQFCSLQFGSWTYDITKLDLVLDPSGPSIDFKNYKKNNEWEIIGKETLNSTRKLFKRKQRIGNKLVEKEYRIVCFNLKIRRDHSFFFAILVLPSVLLSVLTLVVFWLPPESSVKMLLGMNIFTAFFILLNLLARSAPRAVKRFPLIGTYFCLNMVMITLSTFIATLVTNFYFRGYQSGCVPKLIRRIIIEGIGRLLLLRQFIPLPDVKKMPGLSAPLTKGQSKKVEKPHYVRQMDATEPRYLENSNELRDDGPLDGLTIYGDLNSDTFSNNGSVSTALELDLQEVKRCIRLYVKRQKDKTRRNMVSMEWRTLAQVLDRLFFFIYVCTVSVMVFCALPSHKEVESEVDFC